MKESGLCGKRSHCGFISSLPDGNINTLIGFLLLRLKKPAWSSLALKFHNDLQVFN
jgi:hypothetical protein